MFIQLQAYWDQPVAFAPRVIQQGETFHCHDLSDLRAARQKLSGKINPIVRKIERDGDDIASWPVDLDELIAETEAEQGHDFQRHYSGLTGRAAE